MNLREIRIVFVVYESSQTTQLLERRSVELGCVPAVDPEHLFINLCDDPDETAKRNLLSDPIQLGSMQALLLVGERDFGAARIMLQLEPARASSQSVVNVGGARAGHCVLNPDMVTSGDPILESRPEVLFTHWKTRLYGRLSPA